MSGESAKTKYIKELIALNSTTTNHGLFLDDDRYDRILQEVKRAQLLRKRSQPLTSKDYRRLRRYDVLCVGGVEKLVDNVTGKLSGDVAIDETMKIRSYCRLLELFDVLEEAHLSTGHKKTRIMESVLKKKYCNVYRQAIKLYIPHCVQCQKKKRKQAPRRCNRMCLKREFVGRQLKMADCMHCRGHFELIDMKTEGNRYFHFILGYQDYVTKFTVLRSLRSPTAKSVAQQLVDIFCLFGAPFFLQSSSEDRKFVYGVIKKFLSKLWPKLRCGQLPVDALKYKVRYHLDAWICAKQMNPKKWPDALNFVQSGINFSRHSDIQRSPHEAMFGVTLQYDYPNTEQFAADTLTDMDTEEEDSEKDEEFMEQESLTYDLSTTDQESTEEEDDENGSDYLRNLLSQKERNESMIKRTNQHIDREQAEESTVLIKEPDGEQMKDILAVSPTPESLYQLATEEESPMQLEHLYAPHELRTTDNQYRVGASGVFPSSLSLILAENVIN